MLAAYGPPKESNKLTKSNYTTYFRKWYQEIKKVLGNIGLPASSALYQVTATPDTVPVNSLVMFMTVPVTHVSKAKVYSFEPLEMRFNGIVSNFETAKSRVWGVIQDYTDETIFTVFKSSAGIQENIVTGLNALQSHCLVSNQANINAAKNTLQSLRLSPNKHPLSLLQSIQTQVLILADLGYPDSNNPALCAEFEANNIENFFIGLTDDELARSMKALIFSKAKKSPMDFMEVLAIVSEDELGSRGRIVHKEWFGTGICHWNHKLI
ncbi:hypothetical protein BDR26DRAFT_901211 [Obelidium mucronatum]|nr:hypothetical protein BDR26DRAFT_901211 [Obelidium mucronatum]